MDISAQQSSAPSNKRGRTVAGWDLYFPGIDYSPEDPRVVLAEAYRGNLQNKLSLQPEELENNRSVPFNFVELRDTLPHKLSSLFEEEPETALPCLGLALYQNVFENWECNHSQSKPFKRLVLPKVIPRLFNVDTVTPLRSLKSNYIGKFVAIRGTVVRVGNVKPLAISMSFKCARCSSLVHVFFKDGKYKLPTSCPTPNCRSKSFLPDLTSSTTIDWQKIRIQEQIDKKEPGRVPRTIECELTEDLVDSCVPGDVVTVCGVVKVVSTEVDKGKHYDKNKSLFLIYIDANSVDNNKQIDNGKMELMQFTTKEMYAIQEISDERNIFRLIVNSLCPGIYGHEMVKAGLALTLFGGCQKFGSHPNKLPVRGDPHMLIVGDPGLGKSQMLTAINNVAPRGVYVCGSYSSTTGLTVSLLKESGSGDYALEAGALVLGDQGCCCIDEFDKMGNEHQALMEAMEQQSVSIAKAGIVCNLPARTSVIAAANPVGGHYNRAKTVCENLKMSQALLSRFDLIFILLDKPDEEKDQLLSEHVMALHGGNGNQNTKISTPLFKNLSQRESTLMEKLRIENPQSFEPIHPLLLRKYIGYARKYVHPTLTPEAAQVIQKFYLSLREKHRSADSTPITTRQLESLIRLSEARAKLELREEVSEEDAQDVIEIMKESLFQRFEDEFGNIDFRRNSGMSKSKEVGRFVQHLSKIAEQTYNSIFTAQQLKEIAREMKLQISVSIEDFIENLNTQGYLLRKAPGYKLMTVSSEFAVRNS